MKKAPLRKKKNGDLDAVGVGGGDEGRGLGWLLCLILRGYCIQGVMCLVPASKGLFSLVFCRHKGKRPLPWAETDFIEHASSLF